MKDSLAVKDQKRERHPRAASVYSRALRYGTVVTLMIAVGGSVIGYFATGMPGVYSALLGASLALVFMGLTAVSFLVAMKLMHGGPPDARFFGIISGVWLLKLIVFVIVAVWLGGQSWLDPSVFFFASLAAVIGILLVDVFAVQTSREPYVTVRLPGEISNTTEK